MYARGLSVRDIEAAFVDFLDKGYAMVASGKADSAGGVLITALMAEGTKIGLIVLFLVVVLAMYDDVVAAAPRGRWGR